MRVEEKQTKFGVKLIEKSNENKKKKTFWKEVKMERGGVGVSL